MTLSDTGSGQRWGDGEGSARVAAVADLYRHALTLAAAGDVAGARRLHDAAGHLLDGCAPADRAGVVDLADERAKRGGS